MVNLSKRMLMNVSMIPKGSSVADIGCDHGWVSIYLVSNKLANNVIAMDVADGPLEMARSHIREAGLDDKITVRKSDGLCELYMDEAGSLEVETVLIAGMGGHLAIKLIEQSLDKCSKLKYIILQIQSDYEYVRQRIHELGFWIDNEDMVFDEGKYYTAMRIVPTEGLCRDGYSEKELKYGPVLLKKRNKVLHEYLNYKKNGYELIIGRINSNAKPEDGADRTADILHEIEIIDDCLSLFNG